MNWSCIQYTHDVFGKIVIRHGAIDMALRLRKQRGKENSLDHVARSLLPEQAQEEIFQYYFQHRTQKEIGAKYGARHGIRA